MRTAIKKIAAVLAAVSVLSANGFTALAAIPDSAVLNISFDDGSDSYTNYSGSITEGYRGNAISLSGSSQYVTIDDVSDINAMTGDFTVSVWCKPQDESTWTRLYDIGTGTGAYIFLAPSTSYYPGYPRFVIKSAATGTEQTIDATRKLDMDEWNNITVTRESGFTKIYINGLLSASTTDITYDFADVGTTNQNYIGKSQYSADPYFTGEIDELVVYDSAITEEDVQSIAADAYTRVLEQIAAEEEAEREKYLAQYNRLLIETEFTDAAGEPLMQMPESGTVSANVDLKNYRTGETECYMTVTAYSADGTAVYSEQTESVTLAEGGEGSLTHEIYSADADYYGVTVTDVTKSKVLDGGYLAAGSVVFPEAVYDNDDAPVGTSNLTDTYGAHDPTIFKDPESGKYYAYSSHNLIFESEDLVNWTKYSVADIVSVPESTKTFVENCFSGSEVNGTYWAPDIWYREDDTETPYWFYDCVSCGLGGQYSVISLVKSDSPLIFLNEDGTGEANWVDSGVVIASANSANTNAIDPNIYTDQEGNNYLIWGSFWKGIHAVGLNDDGTAEGVDFFGTDATTDAALLKLTNTNYGTRLFSTPSGVVGPEGPYTFYNSDNEYTYMMVSYGWLGTNYNIRLARTDLSFTSVMTGSNPHQKFVDYQGRQVGTTYADQVNKTGDTQNFWGYKMLGSYQLDGITYYGNGHCSAICDDDGNWYLCEHYRKVQDATAYLGIRKMLWINGWPVVSPMIYAGEEEQVIPEMMLYGTYALSSVGTTINTDEVSAVNDSDAYKGSDQPVESCEITLMPSGELAGGIGEWTFDGDHTITITFTEDGDTDENEYYSEGDVVTMYALASFDRDMDEQCIALTGINQDGIAQLAKKTDSSCEDIATASADTTPTVIAKSEDGNPVLGFDADGNILYAGDPAVLVDGDTVYAYAGHDTATTDEYIMPEYVCYSTTDLKNWTYEGVVMSASDVSWASGTTSAWASQVAEHDGKYYLYHCTWANNSTASGYQCIGVAVSDSPTGPFVDIGSPLINGRTMTTENTSSWNDIDPTVWIETVDGEEHIYLNWGNGVNYTCELNSDMISVKDISGDGSITSDDIITNTINNLDGTYTEAPWLYRRQDADGNYYGNYYLLFAKDWREQYAYATTDDIMSGEWEYQGLVMSANATANTSHGGLFDFNGNTYYFYHNGSLPNGSGYRRVMNIQQAYFTTDGALTELTELSTGLWGTASTITSANGGLIAHESFTNSLSDGDYPIEAEVTVSNDVTAYDYDAQWEIVAGKADTENENYVSIQSRNKPGLYLKVSGTDIILAQDYDGDQASKMTFKTVVGLNGSGVSFESVSKSGRFITVLSSGALVLTDGSDADACTFAVSKINQPSSITIENAQIADGTLSFTLTGAADCSDVEAYAAEYDQTGLLVNVKVVEVDSESVSIDYEKLAEENTVKIYAWDGAMLPLALTKVID